MKKKPVYGLICAGGGAHGAYQVGALKYIHERFSHGDRSPFQVFAGSSCGALNTTFYASHSYDAHQSRLLLEELWLNFHVPAYHGNLFKNIFLSLYREWRKDSADRHVIWGLFDPNPMREIVRKGFNRENLLRAFQEGTTLGAGITATELLSGRACWFLEGPAAAPWNLFHSIGVLEPLKAEHLFASCSVPIFLPPVKIGDRYFIDGSVSLDRPLSAAISMGATRLLSIATDKPKPSDLPQYRPGYRPRITDVIRLLLNRLSHDAARDEATQIDMFNRFYRALSRKNRTHNAGLRLPLFHQEALPSHYEPTQICLLFPSKRIRESTGIEDDYWSPTSVQKKRTRFMFHKTFIRELIDLGYNDTKKRHDELEDFFSPNPVRKRWHAIAQRAKWFVTRKKA